MKIYDEEEFSIKTIEILMASAYEINVYYSEFSVNKNKLAAHYEIIKDSVKILKTLENNWNIDNDFTLSKFIDAVPYFLQQCQKEWNNDRRTTTGDVKFAYNKLLDYYELFIKKMNSNKKSYF